MAVSYFSGEAGGDWMKLHFWSGYTILTLVLFRILWGFFGSTTARFSSFIKGPAAVFGHLRELLGKHGPHDAGHNPVGGLMVVALLFAVLLQAATGLFSADTDMGTVNGPLATKVADAFVNKATAFHHAWINIILIMVALHVVALHVHGSNNPLGIDPKGPQDTVPFHPYYTMKDGFGVMVFLASSKGTSGGSAAPSSSQA